MVKIPAITVAAYVYAPAVIVIAILVLLRGQTARRAPLIAGFEPGTV